MLTNTVSLIRASAKGHPVELSVFYRDLIPAVLGTLQSPLAAPLLTSLFVDLHETIFVNELKYIGNLIAHVSLRLLKPACDLDPLWEEENLTDAIKRTINYIHETTIKTRDPELNPETPQFHFSAPMLSYTFPFLKTSLLSPEIKADEKVLHDALQIISEHSKLRGQLTGDKRDIFHPKLLPHRQMFELLVELVSSTTGRVQSQAVACLLDVAKSAGGGENCAKASESELSVLLVALQNPSEFVRDAALRALQLMASTIPTPKENKELALTTLRRVWIAKYDNSEEIRYENKVPYVLKLLM